jgi:hydrogenase maturation protein HypF
MSREPSTSATDIREIRLRGIVQGVGFRPFVYRLARAHALQGEVRNEGGGVRIRIAGAPAALDGFIRALTINAPPLARIDAIAVCRVDCALPAGFRIADSTNDASGAARAAVTPDAAVCADCLAELFDPLNRRYRHPFITCTNCGPRLTIARATPYDRQNTSMAGFAMCADCAREYHDPADRRFHAQPIACPRCGPLLELVRSDGSAIAGDPIRAAARLLAAGAIVAIKGLGGYHLACRATDASAVETLRSRKRRYDKPFALMARDAAMVSQYCHVSPAERALLESAEAPIVLLQADGAARVAPAVAPRQRTLGFMLPYTPLHHLLLADAEAPIVLTSGNLSDEPQAIDDDAAHAALGGIADALLKHDRAIINRADDSVVRVLIDRPRQLRRSRGYAPAPLALPDGFARAPATLALGAQLKSTFCLLRDGEAVLSQHLGDLDDASTYLAYEQAIARALERAGRPPAVVAVDLHPQMASTRLGREVAERHGAQLLSVQHHHAHAAACMAENREPIGAPPMLAIVLDGLGFGPDGSFWGGEFLLADYASFRRLASFRAAAMPGGERAIREPWRMAYACLVDALGAERLADKRPAFLDAHARALATIDAMMRRRLNSPLTSACGRLFDAVAATIGLRDIVTYEGQAAIELEALIDRDALAIAEARSYRFDVMEDATAGILRIDPRGMWVRLVADLHSGTPPAVISARFHLGLVHTIGKTVERLEKTHGNAWHGRVALSGGVFQNALLLERTVARLQSAGLTVLSHSHVPPNDGGIAFGQAAVAAAQMLGRTAPCASASPAG